MEQCLPLNKIVTLSAKDADTLCSLPYSEFGEILLMNFINNDRIILIEVYYQSTNSGVREILKDFFNSVQFLF